MTAKSNASTASKYSNLSSASFLDLRAELSRKESEFASTRHLGSTTTGVKRPGKKPSAWQRSNKGLSSRLAKDQKQYEADGAQEGRTPEQVKERLERKARLYDKIKKGKSAGLTEGQIQNLLVDFDAVNGSGSSDSGSDSEDESATVPVIGEPLVEYTDEFGRTRMIPRSDVPRGVAVPTEGDPAPANVHYGDQHHFPVYVPSTDLLQQRLAALESQGPLVQHYDSTTENRQRGAGFMAFSQDEEERARQMEALNAERKRTEGARREGAESGGVKGEREREKEERKRLLGEKRKALEEKRSAKKRKEE